MAHHREPLPRLNIPQSLNVQQPMAFDGGQPTYSPALPTSLQHSFHPPFPMNNTMQTPMQPYFPPRPPPAPGRPTHRQAQASIAQLAMAGIVPPNGFPMTSGRGHFPRPSLMLGPGQPFVSQHGNGPPFPNRNRRQLSIGGPPKAVLGGPARKHSPLPPQAVDAPAGTASKPKKVTVNLPKETIPGEDGEPGTRPSWARIPLDAPFTYEDLEVLPAELTTAELFPSDNWRHRVPDTIDVFLPSKRAWDTIKKLAIEEKLQRLGVERGSGSNVPHILAPHARAASISSPADPALLFFKLNKLQESQASSNNSLSTSPQPPFGLSPSPHHQPPRFMTNRHGHSMSLAQPPSQKFHDISPRFNPLGPNAVLSDDQVIHQPSPRFSSNTSAEAEHIHAPQGRVPVAVSSLTPPLSAVRPNSRPDFIRGFGLDIPEEEEVEEERGEYGKEDVETSFVTDIDGDASREDNADDTEEEEQEDGLTTVAQSRFHSRHVSRLSAALSLRSVGGLTNSGRTDLEQPIQSFNLNPDNAQEDTDLEDAVEEWTGSEDYMGESSDDESIGEWSNPSDEERARQHRLERRMRRRAVQPELETPRRLPNFPRPPDNTIILPHSRDNDIISNPSEEEHLRNALREDYLAVESGEHYPRPPSNSGARSPRPLPPLPHSRMPSNQMSGQLSAYDPTQTQTPPHSDQLAHSNNHQSKPSLGQRRDSLNPFAKPFVFGAPRESSESQAADAYNNNVQTPSQASLFGHSRMPSFGKPLNAAAQEFKPTGFNFRPPPGVPQMPSSASETARPLPVPPVGSSPARQQGREKRQRRGSNASAGEGDSMTSFKFPLESPQGKRRSASPGPRGSRNHKALNPSAEPFTFAGVSSGLPFVPKESIPLPHSLVPQAGSPAESFNDDSTAKAENEDSQVEDLSLPSNAKPKRSPIPLDFKHPVSQNTVPAGLFKALINGTDERTRRTVRSRLGSRETFEHARRPSLDDLNVPPISHKISRSRIITDPEDKEISADDIFTSSRRSRHRPSLPDALHSAAMSSISGVSIPAMDLSGRTDVQQYEMLASLLDEKLSAVRHDLANMPQPMNTSTEAMVTEVLSLFRTQLQESAARSLEDSRIDAHGELDLELIKDVINQGHAEARTLLQRELDDIVRRLGQMRVPEESSNDMRSLIEQLGDKTIGAVAAAISELSELLKANNRDGSADERQTLVHEFMSQLTPVLSSIRAEPVDYDLLTSQLTQAVKPHISQLIDLASDKRETAGLIVDRILPLLSSHVPPGLDTDAITLQLTTEVRRAIAPIDAFEIKEQVADLVVERLDSRLAVRDKTFNVETVTGEVREVVTGLLEPVQNVAKTLITLVEGQQALSTQHNDLSSAHKTTTNLMSKLSAAIEALNTAGTGHRLTPDISTLKDIQPDETLLGIKSTMDQLAGDQETLAVNSNELLSLHKGVFDKLSALSEALAATTNTTSKAYADLALSQEASNQELNELRKLNTDNQIQLTKARGAHGQVRVEKDVLSDKLTIAENERDQLRAQMKELQASVVQQASEAACLTARNSELEDALAQALARLQASDVATQANQERIAELAKSNRELASEKQALKFKVDSLELQVTFASRDKENVVQALAALQSQHDHLSSQQSHWDDLRRASQQIETLTTLIGYADNEELKELRRIRDHSRVLEGENAVLQRRVKDQESKMANSDKAALSARQSLAQAQQRASEWERRAKEHEGQLDRIQIKLDQAEQAQAQLDADYSLVKLQLEEREADDRLAKDRESKIRDQAAALEAKVAQLQAELDRMNIIRTPTTAVPPVYRKSPNGNIAVSRPDSRASTLYGDSRSATPNTRSQSRTWSPGDGASPQGSVWDSMHAPNANRGIESSSPYPHPAPSTSLTRHHYYPTSIPSPTPSTVSLAPTPGEDGWWS